MVFVSNAKFLQEWHLANTAFICILLSKQTAMVHQTTLCNWHDAGNDNRIRTNSWDIRQPGMHWVSDYRGVGDNLRWTTDTWMHRQSYKFILMETQINYV